VKILLTNDDGLRAPGIEALHDALVDARGEFGGQLGEEVWPCAPLTVQSATSHGVTFHQPLMVTEARVSERMAGAAVDGRPADCVKLAISSLWPERFGAGTRPDLVISGMNGGANVGINVVYSGTVAAALEAAFLGVPSIAVSLHLGPGEPLWDVAAAHARRAIQAILDTGLLRGDMCVNVNVPRTEGPHRTGGSDKNVPLFQDARGLADEPDAAAHDPTTMPPIRVCPMNTHGLMDAYERRVSPAGDVYYWAAGGGMAFKGADEGADVDLLFKRCVTVTPLWHDLTDRDSLGDWSEALGQAAAKA